MAGKAKGFGELVEYTPVFDQVIEKYGRTTALVFGRVWRRCQGIDAICWESVPNMAKNLDLSTRTVIRSIRKLVDAGEVFRIERPGKSSLLSYVPTPARESGVKTMTPARESGVPLTESHGTPARESHEDTLKEREEDFKELIQRQELKEEARAHFHKGPKRDKRLDDYYLQVDEAMQMGGELPERPEEVES